MKNVLACDACGHQSSTNVILVKEVGDTCRQFGCFGNLKKMPVKQAEKLYGAVPHGRPAVSLYTFFSLRQQAGGDLKKFKRLLAKATKVGEKAQKSRAIWEDKVRSSFIESCNKAQAEEPFCGSIANCKANITSPAKLKKIFLKKAK